MAQLVEQRIRNAWVPGSSPGIGSTIFQNDCDVAVIAQLVEHQLPKLGVAGSSPVYRSIFGEDRTLNRIEYCLLYL